MDLSVREAARLLAVTEETVHRWIRDGALPAHHVGHQLRLNRVELQEWATSGDRLVSPELFAGRTADVGSGLAAALERGGIFRDVPGTRREEVLRAVAQLPHLPDLDRGLLEQLLLARDALGGTSIGHGIALPHPRDPLVLRVREPHVLLCFLATPVDFGAADGEPAHTLFLLLAPSVRAHLETLARLAYVLHDAELRAALRPTATPAALLARVRAVEERSPRR